LFEQTHDAVFILDLDGNHLAANQRAADMLGYPLSEIVYLTVRDISADIRASLGIIERLVDGEHVPLYETKFRRKNGEVFPVEVNVELVCDSEGRPLHIQSVVRDISHRKQVEDALRQANELLNQRVAEVERLQAELREQALRDPLTGLHNRRYLSETLPREIARAERENEPVSVIVSDIDNFKMINDTYGHQAGDRFLVEIAGLMKNCTRISDVVCRYGGEEFLLVFPGASLACAAQRAEEIRQKIADTVLQHEGRELHTTISFGVAAYPDHGTVPENIIIKADKALYMSKQAGRNRVTIWQEDQ
jgi:diguanylate cyclase (GGDEF)-like protein/PAS domain S-box-containing protein